MADEWLTVEQAARRLNISTRQMHRYAARVQTRQAGRRTLFYGPDIERLAGELGVIHDARQAGQAAAPERSALVPAGEMLDYIRQRDQQLAEYQRQLQEAIARAAAMEAELRRRALPEDVDQLRADLNAVRAEREQLAAEAARLRGSGRTRLIFALVAVAIALILAGVLLAPYLGR